MLSLLLRYRCQRIGHFKCNIYLFRVGVRRQNLNIDVVYISNTIAVVFKKKMNLVVDLRFTHTQLNFTIEHGHRRSL